MSNETSTESFLPSNPEAGLALALERMGGLVLSMWQFRHTRLEAFAPLVLLCVSDGVQRARVEVVSLDLSALQAGDWAALLPDLKRALARLGRSFDRPLIWCRLEWPFNVRGWQWQTFGQEIKRYKRNYFRSGLAFVGTSEPRLLLSEMELNANACLYPGGQTAHAEINRPRLERYIRARHGSSQMPDFADDMPLWSFATDGIFLDVSGEVPRTFPLETRPGRWGRREIPPLATDSTAELIGRSTRFLGRQVEESGRYIYGYFPCFDRRINNYNVLRHASSTYALLEGYEACRDQRLLSGDELEWLHRQIVRALTGLCDEFVIHRREAAYVVDTGDIIKLGANAVSILALVKFQQVMRDHRYAALADALALGITRMQAADGSFVHVLDAGDLSVRERSRIIYYDGEAAFALMRLYGQTGDSRWLDCVIKAFDYFIANGHEKAHDHWLAYCANELVIYRPERRYFAFAIRNVAGYIDFIRSRITTFPTLLELSMAFHGTLLKLKEKPEWADLLDGFNVEAFYQALHARANHLLNGFFWPEVAMFFKAPATILDGFFIRHHGFRVRIDDVEHYLSGMVAYRRMLSEQATIGLSGSSGELNAEMLAAATGGKWVSAPPRGWQARGICTWSKAFQPGQMVVARSRATPKKFLPSTSVKACVAEGASAVLCVDGSTYHEVGVPVLQVPNVFKAIVAIAKWQRQCYAGRVVGITGSAGKTTTVAMLAHALAYSGEIGQTRDGANLPIGIARNISSMPQQAPYWVIEMAIGSMDRNTALARPDIAIVTNIAASHLVYHASLDEIARKKARIFSGMQAGGVAILYRDMQHYHYFVEQAKRYRLKVVSFGEHADADIRLLEFSGSRARLALDGTVHDLVMSVSGRHMVLNALALLAVAQHDGLPLNSVLDRLTSFRAIAGRGEMRNTTYQDIPVRVFDEAYNANPLSMRMALETFDMLPVDADQKLVIVGDMLELGDKAEELHLELMPLIASLSVRRILLCGDHCRVLAQQLGGESAKVFHFEDIDALASALIEHLKPLDSVFVKASNGMKLHKIFSK